ncbi:MAG: heme o synthase [Acidobacteria bacterium]|nr:heme o synthase [Acidobacteriota bacterium]MCW5968749.1 heme o synthase [Blastocatellales bacterium]
MEVGSSAGPAVAAPYEERSVGVRLRDYVELTKPRITFLVMVSSLAGFYLGAQGSAWGWGLLHTAVGIALLSGGIAALNQYLERDLDALMRRTMMRPLPAGRLSPRAALLFGVAISLAAEIYLAWFLNPLTAIWGLVALGSYLFLYTPLKTRTTWCTFIGAFPGALPPLLGWTAARNEVGIEAVVLFGILFFWQFPHFHAIASIYREDYGRAGIRMLPVVEADGRSTARQIVVYTLLLIPVSALPAFLDLSGRIYLVGALILGGLFLAASVSAARTRTKTDARRLLKASVLYLPLLLALMALNR